MTLSHKTQLDQFQLAQQQQEKYAKTLLEKAVLAQQQAAYTTNNTGGLFGSYTHSPIPIEVPQHNLNEGAWDVAISQLVDLWVVKHGSAWVSEAELDDFYEVAAQRLKRLNKLEQHYVNGSDVYRIVE